MEYLWNITGTTRSQPASNEPATRLLRAHGCAREPVSMLSVPPSQAASFHADFMLANFDAPRRMVPMNTLSYRFC
jgi:hypothetical protein